MYREMIIIPAALIAVIAALLSLAGNYFYNYAILRRRKEFLNQDADLPGLSSDANWTRSKEWLEQQSYEELTITSDDSLRLKAIYLPASSSSDKIAILVHGYNSWNGSMAGFAKFYSQELGYNVLMPDLRGHGKSEGSYIGFGWHDRKDMQKWIDFMLQKHGSGCEIILHGVSMGGATVLMTGGESLPHNVKCIISDCAYTSIEGILSYQMKRMFKLPSFPLLQFTSLVCRLRAGYSIIGASAVNQVRKCRIPILFIHGGKDKFVPTEMVHELYDAAGSHKQLLIVPDAAHAMSLGQDPEAYKAAVKEFLGK